MITKFTLTKQHISLLQHAYVDWYDCETGAPAIDPKRPYGNSYVPGDMAEILDIDLQETGDGYADKDIEAQLLKLHRETDIALQIVLTCKTFRPGEFEREPYKSWRRVE
jgi:hypothetical protein